MSEKAFENPMLAVDVIALQFVGGDLLVGLSKRKFAPHKGEIALPGVLMAVGERVLDSARRALETKVDVAESQVRHLMVDRVHDTPGRDDRGPTVAISCIAAIDPDAEPAAGTHWVPLHDAVDFTFPFDHQAIIRSAQVDLAGLIWSDPALMRGLLGERFGTADMARLVKAVTGKEQFRASIRRMLSDRDWITESNEANESEKTGRGRPQRMWTFTPFD